MDFVSKNLNNPKEVKESLEKVREKVNQVDEHRTFNGIINNKWILKEITYIHVAINTIATDLEKKTNKQEVKNASSKLKSKLQALSDATTLRSKD